MYRFPYHTLISGSTVDTKYVYDNVRIQVRRRQTSGVVELRTETVRVMRDHPRDRLLALVIYRDGL